VVENIVMSDLRKKSICRKCKNLEYSRGIYCCGAFPPFPPFNGIPDKFLFGEAEHRQVDEGQFSNVVYENINDDLPVY